MSRSHALKSENSIVKPLKHIGKEPLQRTESDVSLIVMKEVSRVATPL